MKNFIRDTKYRAETISIVVDFSDMLSPGDLISGTPTIVVTVFSGLDLTPQSLLYLGITIIQGVQVEQRVRLGVIGCIYTLNYTIVSVAGRTYEKEFYLAILPEDQVAIPTYQTILQTSLLYPYELKESLTGSTVLTGGGLRVTVYQYNEGLKGTSSLLGGTLTLAGVSYNRAYDSLKGTSILIGGTLVLASTIYYNRDNDSLKGRTVLLGGTLVGAGITYNYVSENLRGLTILTGGTLV